MNRLRLIQALGAASLIDAGVPARAADLKAYKAGAAPIDSDAVLFWAQSQGFFAQNGLDVDVKPFGTGDAIAAALLSGDLDFGSMNAMSLAVAHQNGVPIKIIAAGSAYTVKAPTTQTMVLKSSPLKTPKDLNGKTIAVNVLRGITQIAAMAWIDKNGGDSKSVKFAEMPFPLMPAALTSNRVDAAVIAEPALTASKSDSRILGNQYDGFGPALIVGTYIASDTWIQANPDAVRKVRSAIGAAAAWANSHHADTAPLLAKLSKLDEAIIEKTTRASYGEMLDPKLIQPIIDAGAQYGFLKRSFPASELIAS